MTLRENLQEMKDIIYKADTDFTAAKTKFVSCVTARRNELIALADKFSSAPKARWTQPSFGKDYLELFMKSFDVVDKKLDNLLALGAAMAETDFDTLGVDAVGIDMTPMILNIGYFDILHPSRPYLTLSYNTPAYDVTRLAEFKEEIKQLMAGTLPGCEGYQKSLLFIKSDYHASDVSEWAPVIMTPVTNKYLFQQEYRTGLWGAEPTVSTCATTGIKINKSSWSLHYNGTFFNIGASYEQTGNTAFASEAEFRSYFPIAGGTYHTIDDLGAYVNIGENEFKFDRMLNGNFGPIRTTVGLDKHLSAFHFESNKSLEDWFKAEANEFNDVAAKISTLTQRRALEQMANLYAAKYAILRIMHGHLMRLRQNAV